MMSLRRQPKFVLWRTCWLSVSVCCLAFSGFVEVVRWKALSSVCRADSTCLDFQLDAAATRTLAEHEITMTMYVLLTIAIVTSCWLVWYGIAGLICWRSSDDRGAILSALFLVV